MTSKIIHRKLKIDHANSTKKPEVNACVPEGIAVPAPLITPVVLLLNDTSII